MQLNSNKNIWVIISSLCVAVVLLITIFSGLTNGKKIAQSNLVIKNAQSLTEGLGFFFLDQDRFPTAIEFSEPTLMVNYFGNFPPHNFVSETCSESFVYKRPTLGNFELNFCLPKKTQGFKSGWNVIAK